MAAIEILRILNRKEIATADELAKDMGINRRGISESLNSMLNSDVDRVMIHVKNSRISYAWKIKGKKISKEKLNKYQMAEC